MITKEKRIIASILNLILIISFLFVGCDKHNDSQMVTDNSCFSVHFLDVGNGDCIFINFGDGKTMLIDCAEKTDKNQDKILNILNEYFANELDYLVLTHPDNDHVGNLKAIADKVVVDKAYVPKIDSLTSLSEYSLALDTLREKGTEFIISEQMKTIKGGDYLMLFLSPYPVGHSLSSYGEYNLSLDKTEDLTNDLSPIIYLEYNEVKFLFTGDAGKSQEKIVLDSYFVGAFNQYLNDQTFSLENIDFLKVAHHGASSSTSLEFLEVIKPKNAVISVGGNNFYGHPSTTVISNLIKDNEEINIYRTDRDGSVSVFVDEEGKISVMKESGK